MTWKVSWCSPGSASRTATMKKRPYTVGSRVTLIWLKRPMALTFPSCAVMAWSQSSRLCSSRRGATGSGIGFEYRPAGP
jgi:hypothetical protein